MPAIFITIFAWIIGIAAAIYLGTSMGDGDYLINMLAIIICTAIAFVCWIHRYTLVIILSILLFQFVFYTFGFNINPEEISCLIALGLMAMYIWQPEKIELPPILQTRWFKFLKFAVLAWCAYSICHAIFYLGYAKLTHMPGFRNIVKSYFHYVVPYVILAYFVFQPQRLRISPRIFSWLVGLSFFAILVNAGLRFHQQLYGIVIQMNEDTIPEAFFIPYLNLVENIFALRQLGPFSALLGTIILTSSQWKKWKIGMQCLGVLTILLGLFGGSVGGGRASLVVALAFIFAVIFLRKKHLFLIITGVSGIIFIALINIYSKQIYSDMPFFVTRSVQLLVINKKTEAIEGIKNSTEWRDELHEMAIEEWLKNSKNFFTGRGLEGMLEGEDWYTSSLSGDGYYYGMNVSLRRGATHAMVTDLLIVFGLLGALVYYTFLFSVLIFAWNVFRNPNVHEISRDISLILVVGSFVYIGVATIAEGTMNSLYIWILITLVASLQAFPLKNSLGNSLSESKLPQ